ncbi:hypothetical protein BD626DRAFT_495687 [Schizophyllum amplum]|uniref:Uncharacterized protein n=1 Tax=Schizophyllum amplum TaxID=97359 RepID=A0A550CEC6_9AGAR|nr:hypothetical protein BD626DRAFT_495687 [Auriculariopsis ampla]
MAPVVGGHERLWSERGSASVCGRRARAPVVGGSVVRAVEGVSSCDRMEGVLRSERGRPAVGGRAFPTRREAGKHGVRWSKGGSTSCRGLREGALTVVTRWKRGKHAWPPCGRREREHVLLRWGRSSPPALGEREHVLLSWGRGCMSS